YRAADAEAERYRLLERIRSLGLPDARVTIESTIREGGDGGDEVDLAFLVAPGPEVRVGRVFVQRNFYTRDRVIRRELDLEPGDPLDPTALLDAQARLYRLGLFRSVSVNAAESEEPIRDVHLRVAERPGGELQYGFGYNTSTGVRSFLQLAHRNVAGTGRALSIRGDVNLSRSDLTPDEYLGDAGARAPRLFETRWDGRANFVVQHRERDVDEFSIERVGVSAGVERDLLPSLQATFLVELDDSRIFDVAPDAVLTGKDVGRLRTVSLNPILVFDGRDDAFAPTLGVFETVRLRYGAKAFGSEVGFVKLTGQHAQYVPLGRRVTWLYSVRAGIAEALEGASSVPLRERFFLGGRTTVRGFDENEIGPRGDEGNPVGGDLSLNVNTEVRFPLAFGIEGAVFFDGGGLYLREEAIAIDEFREGAGPGLRYQTPIGALSLDYGFKLDRRGDESIGEIHFSIGNVF
ncbi:MAG: BamA/OMP85 family outer membrane protein, partial [Candidatus Binatia bacterium]